MIEQKHFTHDIIDSTNQAAKRYIDRHAFNNGDFVVISAKQQTNARGRLGKKWHSSIGNLHLSIIIKPDCKFKYFGQISFIASLALKKTIQSFLKIEDHKRISLKWPNDVLIDDKKVAGILLETHSSKNNVKKLIVGIGVNLNFHPKNNVKIAATNLHQYSDDLNLEEFKKELCNNFASYYQNWERFGFDDFKLNWLKSAKGLNQKVMIQHGDKLTEFTLKSISDVGEIVVQNDNNIIEKFASGEVTYL